MWASTFNNGDDIQALAAIDLLSKNGINEYSFIDREKLADYTGPPTKLVMNGWFMNRLSAFPPPESVTPLFISFHVADPIIIKKNLNYFKKHEPIGCRDTKTVELFLKSGIDAYFSGCLSMCFDEVKEKGDAVYVVDNHPSLGFTRLLQDTCVPVSAHPYATYIKHRIPKGIKYSIEERLLRANGLLELYKRARLVVTSRLHCALPCRAFNTNVEFTLRRYDVDGRFSGVRKYVAKGKIKVDREIINERKEITKNLFKSLL